MESGADRASELRAFSGSGSTARRRQRNLNSLAWGVLVIACLLSLWAATTAWRQTREHARAQFDARADAVATAVATHMNAYEDTVRAAAAVLEGRQDIEQDSFHAFVEKLQIPTRQSGVHGLGFARRVRLEERDAYLATQRTRYGDAFAIHPVGDRDEYVVIDLLYPDAPGMRPLLGKDVMAETVRRDAIESARDSGELATAPLVALGDASKGSTGLAGFLLYAPVYADPVAARESVDARRRLLRGFATAGFGWQRVMEDAVGHAGGDEFDLQLLERDHGEQPIFQTQALKDRYGDDWQPAFTAQREFRLLGSEWRLVLRSPPLREAVPGLASIALLTLCGIGLGLLLFLLLHNLARTERRSRALLDAVADHLPALIAYIDGSGRYGFANRACRAWSGSTESWSERHVDDVHANAPDFLASLKRAMQDCTPDHWIAWEAELGQPARAVHLYLVPDVESSRKIAGWYLMGNDVSEQRQAHRELAMARDHLKRVTDRLPAMIAQFDAQQRLVFHNRAFADQVRWRTPPQPGVAMRELFGEEAYLRRMPHIEAALAGRDGEFESGFSTADGARRMHSFYTPDIDETGRVCGFFVMSIDITEKARLEHALHDANELAEVTLTSISEAVITVNVASRVTYMNPTAEALCGWSLEQALDQPLDQVAPLVRVEAQESDDTPHPMAQPGDLQLVRRDGSRMLVECSLSSIHDRDERMVGTVMVLRDITESRALSSRMTYLAHHDALTGLPNRLQLNERLGQAITHATNHGNGIAVLFLDLDLFKHVNDALGHHTGDELLQQVARRLQRNIGNLGTVYRTGGDEFVVLLPNVLTRDSVLQLADRLLALGGTPYTVASHELHQAFSIGISLFPEDGYDAATLMMRADAAMYLAKRNGRNATRFYTRELASSVDARIELENSLRRSLRNGDLSLHYQPQVDRVSGRIVGVEGLARWQRGDRLMMPGEFLPIAEETNLIVDIDQWAIRAACRQNRIWQQAGLPPIRVSVNVAAANFDTDDLVDTVVEALQDSGLPAEFLELEVTETTLMRDVQRTDRTLRALKALGVRIAIDDFGTGFSSLSYLGNYGFNVLKIDQSFVRDVSEPNQAAITRAIISLASQLQCRTIAEGVETLEQAAWLAANGCDELQGNYFSKPVPAAEFAKLYARGMTWDIPQASAGDDTPAP
ncbi:EAL domain-containing protein [Pseudoxanthomonas sp. PXM02]|uniref:EAL domain-containing protein n=1 Tax=Pseudoxanthomonas sp. PXM02 TaxID=2769294 RepID=UPI0017867ECF|nr:EAL domain-containing protein [Pseudoxanthomonas sp. PXM02]